MTSYRLCFEIETTQGIQLSGDTTLQNNKLWQKYSFRIFSNGVEELSCKNSFGEHLFCILHVLQCLSKTASS